MMVLRWVWRIQVLNDVKEFFDGRPERPGCLKNGPTLGRLRHWQFGIGWPVSWAGWLARWVHQCWAGSTHANVQSNRLHIPQAPPPQLRVNFELGIWRIRFLLRGELCNTLWQKFWSFSYSRNIIFCYNRSKQCRFLWFNASLGVHSPWFQGFNVFGNKCLRLKVKNLPDDIYILIYLNCF